MESHRPRSNLPRTAIVIPSLGSPTLASCLVAVASLDPAPQDVVVVLSGGATIPGDVAGVEVVTCSEQLGYAAAVNRGFRAVASGFEAVAVLNDDAVPSTGWLGRLQRVLADDAGVASVQGTIHDSTGTRVDGRGIALDRWRLPVQLDRDKPAEPEPDGRRPILAVSGTAALYRTEALAAASTGRSEPFDSRFGSYHEDLDLGLRLQRLGWRSAWVGGAPTRHHGSSTGRAFPWRHPWWLLANRWRAFAGNLSASALARELPRMVRGEVRAVRALARDNPRSLPVSAVVFGSLPAVVLSGWRRRTPGQKLRGFLEPV